MTRYLTRDEVAALPEGTVLIGRSGETAQAMDVPEVDRRWGRPGSEELDRADDLADGWRVLRYGERRDPAPACTAGRATYSTDGGMLSVRSTGDGVDRPVAMCTTPGWARALADTLNAAEVEGYPVVMSAAQRIVDLQAEYERRARLRDRLDSNTREAVAGVLGVLGMGPLTSYGAGTTPALVAIRERVRGLWATEDAVLSAAALLWRDAPASHLDNPAQVVKAMASEIRALRRANEPVPGVPAGGGTEVAHDD